jgi:segregation and condensation protein A
MARGTTSTPDPKADVPGYRVVLPVYEGPLDLLLRLIERQELDITEVSLARVTDQFLEYVGRLGQRDADTLASFLVVAAKLLQIKSRVLLPQPPASASPEASEDDIGEDLVQQLIEYRKFKEAAGWLQTRESQALKSYLRMASGPSIQPDLDLGDITLDDLLASVRQVLAVKPPDPSVNGAVPPIGITIADQIDLIERATTRRLPVSFLGLLQKAANRIEVIVTLLALLELVKQQRVSMRQDRAFGDILIEAREAEVAPSPGTP